MKQKLFTTKFYAALFAAGLLFASLTVSAQVKIGLNPTTIGANSNLEVEGASGYKTTVDKNGKVTIFDGTQADGRVLTSDANGVASWKSSLIVAARNTLTLQPTGGNFYPPAPLIMGDPATWNEANGEFTAPSDGFYQINYSLEIQGPSGQLFSIAIMPLTVEDGNIRGVGINWNDRSVSGTKFLTTGQKYTPTVFRGGNIAFDTNWKIRNVNVVIFKMQ